MLDLWIILDNIISSPHNLVLVIQAEKKSSFRSAASFHIWIKTTTFFSLEQYVLRLSIFILISCHFKKIWEWYWKLRNKIHWWFLTVVQSRCFTLAYNRCFTLHKKMWKNMTWTVTYQIATQISSASAQMDVMLQLLSQVPVPLQSDASTSQNLHSWGSRIWLYKGYIPSRIKQKQGHLLKQFTLLFNISDPMLHLLALSSALRDHKIVRDEMLAASVIRYTCCSLFYLLFNALFEHAFVSSSLVRFLRLWPKCTDAIKQTPAQRDQTASSSCLWEYRLTSRPQISGKAMLLPLV